MSHGSLNCNLVQATQPVQQPTIFTKFIPMKTEPNVGIDPQDDDEGVTLTAIQDKTIHGTTHKYDLTRMTYQSSRTTTRHRCHWYGSKRKWEWTGYGNSLATTIRSNAKI